MPRGLAVYIIIGETIPVAMNNIDLEDLLNKYRTGTCSAEELVLLENWYAQWKVENQVLTDDELASVKNDVWLAMANDVKPVKQVKLWPRIAVAAAAVAAITLGTWIYYTSDISKSSSRGTEGSLAYAEDIKPGSVGATLTLANGKRIKLSSATNGELAKEAGVTIKKTADGQLIYEIIRKYSDLNGTHELAKGSVASSQNAPRNDGAELNTNTLSTAKGETYQVKLPDGTAVWLNTASRLTYSATLNQQGQRRVALEGEAYFQVAKDKARPFIVETDKQKIEVLGTHFNISAYPDEAATKTTLLEGSVRVSSSRGNDGSLGQANSRGSSVPRNEEEAITLRPNQQTILKGHALAVKEIDPSESIAWKNGYFSFTDENIQTVMQIISRWYNVEISYEGKITKEGFNGKISRFKKLSEVLNMLEDTRLVHFKIEGRRVIVKN
jgi:transmembrane sensor